MLRLFFLFLSFILFTHSVHSEEVTEKQLLQTFNALPLSFTENKGQINSDMQFISQGNSSTIFFEPHETTFILPRNKVQIVEKGASKSVTEESEYFILKRRFLGVNSNLKAEGEERMQWNTNYFIGNNPSQWHTGVPNYEKIRVSNLYDGIDLVYYGDKNVLKYDMVIQPVADASKVLFYYEGAEGYNVNNDGDLEIYTPAGTVIEKKPYSYQIINGDKREIDVIYKIIDKNFNTIAFEVSSYDNSYPLIIDPELEYATYFGYGILGMDVDDSGCVYVTGGTKSWDFPFLTERYHGKEGYKNHIFVVKFNNNGSGLLYSCLIGGNDDDYGDVIKVDKKGDAIIAGRSESSNFPISDLAYNSQHSVYDYPLKDLFVCKLNCSGDSLIYSTFVETIYPNSKCFMDIDDEGNVYVFGKTRKDYFRVTPEAYDKNPNDLFVCKLNSTGTDLVYSTFFGGSYRETPYGIEVDESGNAYVTGETYSSDFPITYGTYSGYSGFISKFDPSGSELVYSTPIDESTPRAIAIDSFGNVYLTGSANLGFHTTPEAYKTNISGTNDLFVLKISSTGSELLYSTFIGGTRKIDYSYLDTDLGLGIAVDNTGNAYITGYTNTQNFPTTPDAYDNIGNGTDVVICKLNHDGSELLYSTYLGGSAGDWGKHIVVDDNGSVFIAGTTDSWDFPVTENAFDKKPKSMFVCKLTIGNVHYTEENTPLLFLLKPSYPNPFNASTTISFTLPSSGFTKLVIYNITGQKVRELISENITAGIHNVMWDGRDDNGLSLSSGVYISRLSSGKMVTHKRMVLMK